VPAYVGLEVLGAGLVGGAATVGAIGGGSNAAVAGAIICIGLVGVCWASNNSTPFALAAGLASRLSNEYEVHAEKGNKRLSQVTDLEASTETMPLLGLSPAYGGPTAAAAGTREEIKAIPGHEGSTGAHYEDASILGGTRASDVPGIPVPAGLDPSLTGAGAMSSTTHPPQTGRETGDGSESSVNVLDL